MKNSHAIAMYTYVKIDGTNSLNLRKVYAFQRSSVTLESLLGVRASHTTISKAQFISAINNFHISITFAIAWLFFCAAG